MDSISLSLSHSLSFSLSLSLSFSFVPSFSFSLVGRCPNEIEQLLDSVDDNTLENGVWTNWNYLCIYIFTRLYFHCCVVFSCFVSPVVVEKLVSTGPYLKYLYLCIITLQWSEEAQSIAGSGSAAGEHRFVRYDFKSVGDAA